MRLTEVESPTLTWCCVSGVQDWLQMRRWSEPQHSSPSASWLQIQCDQLPLAVAIMPSLSWWTVPSSQEPESSLPSLGGFCQVFCCNKEKSKFSRPGNQCRVLPSVKHVCFNYAFWVGKTAIKWSWGFSDYIALWVRLELTLQVSPGSWLVRYTGLSVS